jgi:hypothetical protein
MNKNVIPAFFFFLFISLQGTLLGQSGILWDIGKKGIFDGTNKKYPMENGTVTVDLREANPLCPTGLGHLASGRETVKKIRILFSNNAEGEYFLHVLWNPGGSGKEQFEVLFNGKPVGKSTLIDGSEKPNVKTRERFNLLLEKGENEVAFVFLYGDGLNFENIVLGTLDDPDQIPPSPNPRLKFPTLSSYESEIGEKGYIFTHPRVALYAPQAKADQARIVFEYLVKAYDELYAIVGIHTQYQIVVYHFPEGNSNAWGGTSQCTIWYGYKNLDLNTQEEWIQHHIPHVSGYIEEMAHNFVGESHATFGWESIGAILGSIVTDKVAGNPVHTRSMQSTRKIQEDTFFRYVSMGFKFPPDIESNLCDRIHSHILWSCGKNYGPNFWPDFFREIRKESPNLEAALQLGDSDRIRNERYRITVDCFDRLPGVNFKNILKKYAISIDVDVKSLHPTNPDWNRRFLP